MRQIIKYFLFGVLLALISACYDSEDSDIIGKEVAQTVTFTLNTSDNSCGTSSTTDNENISSGSLTDNENITGRSLTDNEENTLNTANVLAFVDDGAGNYSFSYRSPGRNITTPSSGTTTFKVDLKQYPNKQLFVILANSNSEIIDSDISTGDPLETALSKLVTSCSTEWPARNNGDVLLRHIPMYGKTAGIIINSATTNLGPITLVRMLARIDVRVESTVTNFQLKEVCVFNRKDRGFIAYKDANWDNVNQRVTCADVPASVTTTKLNNILYQANSGHEVLRSIYTFEARGVTDKKDATAIVVGGYFDYPTNQSKVSYYRVDIPAYDSNGKQLPSTMGDILRNHLYNVEIQKVTNKGYDTPEEAFNGVIKVDANIVPWNLATMDEVKDEGIYSLKVSRTDYSMSKNAVTGSELLVSTDYPKGWTSSIEPAGTDWLTVTENGTASGPDSKTLKFDLKKNNTLGDRFARIIVKAGNLKKTIYVSQDVFSNNSGTINLTPWDDRTDWDKDTQFDGYYFLSSNKAFYTLYKNAQQNIPLIISVDHPGKWRVSVTAGNSWLSIADDGLSGATVNGNVTTGALKFNVTENNTPLDRMEGEITIYSGSLKKVIRVKQESSFLNDGVIDWQTDPVNGSIGIRDCTLALSRASCRYDNSGKTRTLTVTGSGGGSWKAVVTPVNGADASWITLNTGTGTATGTSTELKYTMEPNTGSSTRSVKIRVTLYNLCKEILIEQYPNAAIEVRDLVASYKKDDSVIQKFTVVSRAPWKAAVISDTDNFVQQLRNSSGLANTTGEEFRFTLNTISGSTELKADITFTSIDEEFEPYKVTITGK